MFRNYKIAGGLAIVSAVIAIPSMILMFIDMFTESAALGLASAVTQLISGTVFVLLMLYLRSYLEQHLGLGQQKILFGFIIATGALVPIAGIAMGFLDPFSSIVTMLAAMIPSILWGILMLVVAFRIINAKVVDVSYAKAYAYLVGATGLLNATILLSDLALLLGLASDIIMALMFFAATQNKLPGEAVPQLENAGSLA
ncbi:hypothetical protein AAFN46_03055 [Pseudomonas sp. CAU 1711]|uniref:hypothetical protein n=1 Tax=Pseudomonas sp. CAU 1711 TaxID=3140356 RepID=UPI0032600456